jgi:site-specific recombinase XerD
MKATETESRAIMQANPMTSLLGEALVVDDSPLWMAWEGARRAWLDSKRRKSGRNNTVRAYEVAFKQFFEWAAVPPWQVSPGLAQEWTGYLAREGKEVEDPETGEIRREGLSDASLNQKLAALSSFYDFVQRRYSFRTPDGRDVALWPADRRNPFDAVERPQVSAYDRATFPSTDEIQAILDAINTDCLTGKRDFALLYTIMVTCRRSSEVLHMKWGDLRELEDGDYAFSYRYKGGAIKQAVLNKMCYQAICDYLGADGRPPEEMTAEDYIFIPMDPERVTRLPGREGDEVEANRPISNSMANRILKKYARRAEVDLDKAHIHGLRHAGARLRVRQMKKSGRGVDYAEIMELLGHSNLAVTMIYTKSVLEDPEDPGGDAAARALMPKGKRRRRKKEAAGEQGRLL